MRRVLLFLTFFDRQVRRTEGSSTGRVSEKVWFVSTRVLLLIQGGYMRHSGSWMLASL